MLFTGEKEANYANFSSNSSLHEYRLVGRRGAGLDGVRMNDCTT